VLAKQISNESHGLNSQKPFHFCLKGPLAPFPVRCEFFPDGRNITYVGHLEEASTKVDGFEDKGSFQQGSILQNSIWTENFLDKFSSSNSDKFP
jgi:hypothetical protein